MKLFDRIKKFWLKKNKETEEELFADQADSIFLRRDNLEITDEEQRRRYVLACCEQIVDAAKEEEDARHEYQVVTSYLTDIQEIDALPIEEKAELTEISRKIVMIDSEREKYRSTDHKMTDVQYHRIENYEGELPDIIKRIKKNEEYQMLVKKDLQHLEGEKGSLFYRKEELISQQGKINIISRISFSVLAIAFMMILFSNFVLDIRLDIPLLIAASFAIIIVFFSYIKNYRNKSEMEAVSKKLNKIILLLNKIKIKYVNVTNLLEYSYVKYRVNSSHELQFLWERYLEAKAQKERYKKTTDDLDYYNRELMGTLRKYNIKDPNFWIHRTIALINPKEMVEVRHELNTRRQKLRKNMEFYQNNMNLVKEEVKELVKEYPEYAKEILDIVDSY